MVPPRGSSRQGKREANGAVLGYEMKLWRMSGVLLEARSHRSSRLRSW